MADIYSKGKLYLTQHYGDSIKEYYGTDCTGKMLEITTNISNNVSKRLLNYKELPKEVMCKIFRLRECYE
jgi:hypothetical protein